MTRTPSEPGLGAQAAALTARIESSAGLLLGVQQRAAIHAVVLELLVGIANDEATLRRLATAVVEAELDNMRRRDLMDSRDLLADAMQALAAHLRGPGGGT